MSEGEIRPARDSQARVGMGGPDVPCAIEPIEGADDARAEMDAIRAALTQAQRRMILAYAMRTMPRRARWWALAMAWMWGI